MGNLSRTVVTATTGTTSVASGSRAWATGSLIVARVALDTAGTAPTAAMTQSGGSITWSLLARSNANPASCGGFDIWVGYVGTGFTGTITATNNQTGKSVTLSPIAYVSTGAAFSSTPATNCGAVTQTNKNTATTAFTAVLVTTSANSWSEGGCINFTRSATLTASGTVPTVIDAQGADIDGDGYAFFVQSSASVQPTAGSGTSLTLGGSYAATAMGQVCLVEILDPGAGGTNYTPSVSDAVGITDAVTPMQDNARTQTDAVGLTDTATPVQDNVRVLTDSVGIADAATTTAANQRTQSDPVGITDSVTAAADTSRVIADPIGLTDTATATQALVRQQDDPVGITDAVTATVGQTRTVDDPLGITDTVAAAMGFGRLISDPVGLLDTVTPVQDLTRAIVDPVGITDSVTAVITGPPTEYHIFTTQVPTTSSADAQVVLGVEFTTDTDNAICDGGRYYKFDSMYDGLTIQFGLFDDATGTTLATASRTQSAGDPVGWIDIPLTPVTLHTGVNYNAAYLTPGAVGYAYDPTGLTSPIDNPPLHTPATGGRFDYTTSLQRPNNATVINFGVDVSVQLPSGSYVVTQNDNVGITDAASATQVNARTQDDPIGITDAATAAQGFARTISDPIGITDAVTASISGHNYAVTINDAIGITDTSVQQAIDYGYILDPEPIGITDNVVGALGVARTVNDAVGITDTAAAAQALARTVTDPLGITDAVAVGQALARTISDPIGITDSVTAVVVPAGAVVINDPETITDTVTTTQANTRQQDDAVGISDTVTASMGFSRSLADAVGLTDSVAATVAMLRALADSIGITDTVSAVITPGAPINYVAVINDSIGITDEVTAHLPQREIVVAVTTGPSPWAVTTGGPRWAVTTEERV